MFDKLKAKKKCVKCTNKEILLIADRKLFGTTALIAKNRKLGMTGVSLPPWTFGTDTGNLFDIYRENSIKSAARVSRPWRCNFSEYDQDIFRDWRRLALILPCNDPNSKFPKILEESWKEEIKGKKLLDKQCVR